MGFWERSWAITRMSFDVLRRDREMLWFPVLAGFFSLLFSLALLFPTVLVHLFDAGGAEQFVLGPLQFAAAFVTYLGLAFIATFFNVCAVYTTKVRLSGGDATFGESLRFALSRAPQILGWSLLAATVGMVLRGLDNAANRAGPVGEILLTILRGLLGAVWSAITVFVVPSMVYHGDGPVDAVRRSVETLKRTWGESLVRHYGMGFASFLCSLPFLFGLVAGVVLVGTTSFAWVVMGVSVLGLLAVGLVFNLLNTIYNTALFHFATQGTAPAGFEPTVLSHAFRVR